MVTNSNSSKSLRQQLCIHIRCTVNFHWTELKSRTHIKQLHVSWNSEREITTSSACEKAILSNQQKVLQSITSTTTYVYVDIF